MKTIREEVLKNLGFIHHSEYEWRLPLPFGNDVELSFEVDNNEIVLLRDHLCDGIKTGDIDYCYLRTVKDETDLIMLIKAIVL